MSSGEEKSLIANVESPEINKSSWDKKKLLSDVDKNVDCKQWAETEILHQKKLL